MKFTSAVATILSLTALAGCGGGGGGSGSTTSPSGNTAFPLQKAMTELYTAGFQKSTTVSGTATVNDDSYPVTGSF